MRLRQPRADDRRRRQTEEREKPADGRRPDLSPDGRLTADGIGSLQRLAGNTAVTGSILASRRRLTLQRSDPEDKELVEQWIVDVQSRLIELGVSASQMGKEESFRALGESEARRLLGKLEQYKSDRDLRFTSSSKVVRTWNARTDDLGVGGSAGYRTILDYVAAMEAFANASLGGSWPDNLKAMRQAIRVSGAQFHVHPRMLYFAAAAQVGMNEAAGMTAGEGHYLAPAAVFEELRMIRASAALVDGLAADVEKAHARTGSTDPAPGVEGAAVVYANLAGRLKKLVDVRASQGGAGALDHPEPIAMHIDDAMAAEIGKLPASAGDDAEGVERCRDVMVLTWHRPQKKQAHGWGAADPHGTHHALGMAMDAFYGTALGGYANSFKFLMGTSGAEVAAFIVQEHGADYGLEPAPPKALARHIRNDPEAGRAFAVLLKDRAGEIIQRFEEAVADERDPETTRRLRLYTDLRRSIVRGVRVRHAIARALLADRKTVRSTPELKAYVSGVVGAYTAAKVAANRQPAPFLAAGQLASGSYEALRVSLEHDVPPVTRTALDPTAAPDLANPLGALAGQLDDIEVALDIKATAALKRRMPASFRRALDRAASGTLVLDQPMEVLRGFAAVQGARLQSGHHFQLLNWKAVLRNQEVYASHVAADLDKRGPASVQQILLVMSQTGPGFAAIFGGETNTATIQPALRDWAATTGADLDAILESVREQLPPPEMEGISAKRKQLASDMYARGFYDVALAVAK